MVKRFIDAEQQREKMSEVNFIPDSILVDCSLINQDAKNTIEQIENFGIDAIKRYVDLYTVIETKYGYYVGLNYNLSQLVFVESNAKRRMSVVSNPYIVHRMSSEPGAINRLTIQVDENRKRITVAVHWLWEDEDSLVNSQWKLMVYYIDENGSWKTSKDDMVMEDTLEKLLYSHSLSTTPTTKTEEQLWKESNKQFFSSFSA